MTKFPRKPHPSGAVARQPGRANAPASPSPKDLERLSAAWQEQRFADLEAQTRALTAQFAHYAPLWKVLALAVKNQGRREEALTHLKRAIELAPSDAEALTNQGNTLQELSRHQEAEASYRRALEIAPDTAGALTGLVRTLITTGRHADAETHGLRALHIAPDDASVHNLLGNALLGQGKFDEAAGRFRQALALDPASVDMHNNLGVTLYAAGQLALAEASYRQALALNSGDAEVHNNLGVLQRALGRLREAEASHRRALQINPTHGDALNNLGVVVHELGRFGEAMTYYHQALRSPVDLAKTHYNIGITLKDIGLLDEAETHMRQAIELAPDMCDAYSNLLFTVNYNPNKTAQQVQEAYASYEQRFGAPLRPHGMAHTNTRDPGKRLKVGYVSPDFRLHSCRHFLEPLLAHHDKLVVEVFAYAELAQEDAHSSLYRSLVAHWVPTRGLSDEALARRIQADGIDILVDLAGHTRGNRLRMFARKPAPVSLSWLGFGSTTGLKAIDYFLTDAQVVPPGQESGFSETPWRLGGPAFAYRPAPGMGDVSPLPALACGHVTFGTLTRAVRINHRTVAVWSDILKRVAGSRLVVDSADFRDPAMQQRLVQQFAQHGIEPRRLSVGYHTPPWDVLRGIDITLDCFPHNSGTTLFESLYMGVPFITLADRPGVGRLGASILHGLGHPEWVAHDEDRYISLAAALAADLPALAALRGALRQQMQRSALMDEAGFARRVEAAYRQMWHTACREPLPAS